MLNFNHLIKSILSHVYHWTLYLLCISGSFIFKMSLDTIQKLKNDNKGTVIERSEFSANWQSFLKTQNVSKVTAKKPNVKSNREINSYYKSIRLEQKSAKKQGELKNKNMNGNVYGSIKNSDNVTFVKTIANDSNVTLKKNNKNNVNDKNSPVLTKFIAMDCEMVGIGEDARDSMLARVSLVNKFGDCIYDKFVQPRERVMDYRTPVSGVRKEDLQKGEKFEVVQKDVADILKGRFLVGHALKHDIEVLFLSHPAHKIRDTSRYQLFRTIVKGGTPSLKKLTKELLGVDIQSGEHSSVEDARAAMQLYCLHSRQWEDTLARKRKLRKNERKANC